MLDVFQTNALTKFCTYFSRAKYQKRSFASELDSANVIRGKDNKMEVDFAYQKSVANRRRRSVERERKAFAWSWSHNRKDGSVQTTMAYLSVGLMCEHAQR